MAIVLHLLATLTRLHLLEKPKKSDRELAPHIQRKAGWRYYWLTAIGHVERYAEPWV